MGRMGRAVVLDRFNAPVTIRTYEVPDPGPGAILVRVRLAGICGTDIHLSHGRLPIPLPVVLGHETVGIIEKLGNGVTADFLGNPLRVGDLVTWVPGIPCGRCYWCVIEKERTLCPNRRVYGYLNVEEWPHFSGGWADYVYLVPGTTVLKVPDGITAEEVISLGCAGPTAAHAVMFRAQIRAGDTIVIQGSGPVGIAAAMYAKLRGAAKVIIVGGPKERLDLCKRLGIGDVHINIFEDPNPNERVSHILDETEGRRGADLTIEATGNPEAVPEGIMMTRRGGTYLVVGHYTDRGSVPINPHYITRGHLDIRGCWGIGEAHFLAYLRLLPQLKGRYELARLIQIYPLEHAEQAMRDVEQWKVMKGVLQIT